MTATYTIKTAKDGAGDSFNAALQDKDGTGASVAGVHALRNAAGADINPATSDLQTAANASLASIAANTAAGSAITGASMPSGGVGVTGWLSAIWTKLSGTLSFTSANPAFIYTGVQTATLSAVALPSQVLVNGAIMTANVANTGIIYIGPPGVTAANGYPLVPGQSAPYGGQNLNQVAMLSTVAGDVLNFVGN